MWSSGVLATSCERHPVRVQTRGRQRNIAARARQIQTALRTQQLAAPAPVAAAFAATTHAAVGVIAERNRHISELGPGRAF